MRHCLPETSCKADSELIPHGYAYRYTSMYSTDWQYIAITETAQSTAGYNHSVGHILVIDVYRCMHVLIGYPKIHVHVSMARVTSAL